MVWETVAVAALAGDLACLAELVLAWLRLDNPPDSLDVGLVDVGLVDVGLVDAGLVDVGLVDVGLVEAVLDDGLDGDLAVLVVFLETRTGLVGNGLLKTGAFSFRLCVVTENEDILGGRAVAGLGGDFWL